MDVYVRFEDDFLANAEKHSYEPIKWRRIFHDNLAWNDLDLKRSGRPDTRCWRERISHCWISKEHPNSLNLNIDFAYGESTQQVYEELDELFKVFLSAKKIDAKKIDPFIAHADMDRGPKLATYCEASKIRRTFQSLEGGKEVVAA